MDETALAAIAREAGLETVWRDFRADFLAAARQVAEQRKALADGPAPTRDPWPPMMVARGDD